MSTKDDGLLTLEVLYGGCKDFDHIEADESDDENVVVAAVVKVPLPTQEDEDSPACTADLIRGKFRYQLQRPLGSRKLVHAAVSNEEDDWNNLEPQYKGTITPAPRPSQ